MDTNQKEKLKIAQFFRLMDELFCEENNVPATTIHQKNRMLQASKNKDRYIFLVNVNEETAKQIKKICRMLHTQPNLLVSTIIKDYFNAGKIS